MAMSTTTKVVGIIVTLTLTLCLTTVGANSGCPPISLNKGQPCSCLQNLGLERTVTLICDGLMNQGQLTDFMTSVQEVNSDTPTLKISYFFITNWTLSTLDLTPLTLTRNKIVNLGIMDSPGLSTIQRSKSGANKMIVEDKVVVKDTALSNQDVTNLLSYIDPQAGPRLLAVNGSPTFKNVERGSPIIPELTLYYKLQGVSLENTEVTDLYTGAFIGPESLKVISLKGNNIQNLEKDAFKIDRRDQTMPFVIDLSKNDLTIDQSANSFEAGFISGENFGLSVFGYRLLMENNHLEYLPEGIFKDLLYPAGPISRMQLQGNRFICDERMKWMQNIESEPIKTDIVGVDCTNDPGKTIWTANLEKTGTTAMQRVDTKRDDPQSGATMVFMSSILYFGLILRNALSYFYNDN